MMQQRSQSVERHLPSKASNLHDLVHTHALEAQRNTGMQAGQILVEAVWIDDASSVIELLARGADVNRQDCHGLSALMVAACRHASDTALLLLEYGADFTQTDTRGNTALHYAALTRCNTICEDLLQRGADVSARNLNGKHTALSLACIGRQYASQHSSTDMFRTLVRHGADVNAADCTGTSCLEHARRSFDHDLTHLLERHGAS